MKRIMTLLLPSLLCLEAAAQSDSLKIMSTPRTTLSPVEMGAGIISVIALILSIWAVLRANRARRIAAELRRDLKDLKMRVDWPEAYEKKSGASTQKNKGSQRNAKPDGQLSQMDQGMNSVLGRLSTIEKYLKENLDDWVKRTDKSIKDLQQEKSTTSYHDPEPSPEIPLSITPSQTTLYAQLDASNPKRLFNVSKDYDPSRHIYKIMLKEGEQTGDLEIVKENASKVFKNSDNCKCCDLHGTPDPNNFTQKPGKARVNGNTAEVIEKISVSFK